MRNFILVLALVFVCAFLPRSAVAQAGLSVGVSFVDLSTFSGDIVINGADVAAHESSVIDALNGNFSSIFASSAEEALANSLGTQVFAELKAYCSRNSESQKVCFDQKEQIYGFVNVKLCVLKPLDQVIKLLKKIVFRNRMTSVVLTFSGGSGSICDCFNISYADECSYSYEGSGPAHEF